MATSIRITDDYVHEMGGFHDCQLHLLRWSPEENLIEVAIPDLNANFLGLPEYKGVAPGVLVCKHLHCVEFNAPSTGMIQVHDTWFGGAGDYEGQGERIEFRLSPSGSIVLRAEEFRVERD